MNATFQILRSYPLPDRMLYVFAGKVIHGAVHPGMNIQIPLNSAVTMTVPVEGVEFLRFEEGELVALTVSADASDIEFLKQVDVIDEVLSISEDA